MRILRSIQVHEKAPDTTKFVFGCAVPTETMFAAPVPPMAETADDRGVSVEQQTRSARGLPFVSPRVISWLWERAPRHPIGMPVADAAQRARRLHSFTEALCSVDGGFRATKQRVEGKVVYHDVVKLLSLVRPEHAPFAAGMVGSVACAYGLAVEDVIGALVREGFTHPVETIEKWIVSALEGGAFFEWDVEGKKLDEVVRIGEEEARVRAAEQVKVEKVENAPNKSTLDDLGWVGIRARKPVLPSMVLPWNPTTSLPNALLPFPRVEIEKSEYIFFPRAALARVEVPIGIAALGVEILPGSFVPKCTVRQAEEIGDAIEAAAWNGTWHGAGRRRMSDASTTFLRWVLDEVRPWFGISVDGPRKVAFEESTPDGRYRADLYDAYLQEYEELLIDAMGSPIFDTWMQVAFDAGVRGLSLADDVAASIMWRHLTERWFASQNKPADYDASAKRRAKNYETPRAPVAWAPKPLPTWLVSPEALLDKQATKSPRRFFEVDALYTKPDPTVLERLRDVLAIGDPWVVPLKALVTAARSEGRDVNTAAIERALRDAGQLTASLKHSQHPRISQIMFRLGCKKSAHAKIDGLRVNGWKTNP